MLPTPRTRRTLFRCFTGSALFVACAVAAQPAEVVILKDGFVIQGNVRKERENAGDPISRSTTILKADGFDYVDDGPRIVIFSKHNKQLGEISKEVKIRPEYKAYTNSFSGRKSSKPLPFILSTKESPDFNDKWQRTMKVIVSADNDWELIEQQITYLDPYCCFIASKTHTWTQAFRTSEMNAKTVRKLLSTHPDLKEVPGKPEPMKRIAIARFMKDAGWLYMAKEEIDNLKKAVPGPLPKDAQEQLDKLQKEVDHGAAELVVKQAEQALAAGRYKYAAEMLALFPEKIADPKDVDRFSKLMAQMKTATERYEAGRRLLRSNLDDVTGLGAARPYLAAGGGPITAVWPSKGRNPQVQTLVDAAEEVYANLHPDSAGRIEFFVNLASDAEREKALGKPAAKKPDELLAMAISGWARGRNGATEKVDLALRMWTARAMVLDYQRGGNLNERNAILHAYKSQPNPVGLDELTQIISLVPPAEPEDLEKRTGKLVTGKGVPESLYRRHSAPYGQHPAGIDYLVKLPPEYQHGRAYPVLIALTYPTLEPEQFITAFAHEADKNGYIIIAPDWAPIFGPKVHGWSWDGADHDFVTGALRDAIRHFTIDNDRVFLIGGTSGGDMAMDVGASHPDLFAGVVAVGPNPKWGGFFENYWRNTQKLPFYVVTGELAGDAGTNLRHVFGRWMRNGFPSLEVLYRGRGYEWYPAETAVMFDWMSRKKRATNTSVMKLGTGELIRWRIMREEDNHFYWLGADKVHPGNLSPDSKPNTHVTPADLCGDIKGNLIDIKSRGVRQISIWLGRDMIDWSREIKISINGVVASGWKAGGKKIEQDINVLMEDYWLRGDRRMLYLARLEFPNHQ
jgi:pimeloyl-ACP methyl ester carboxylesterase